MSTTGQPVEPKKQGKFTTIFIVICGGIAMIGGGMKMYEGIGEMLSSGKDPQYQQLLEESDQAIDAANKLNLATQPRFVSLLTDAEKSGLESIRKDKRGEADDISKQFGLAAVQFRLAAQKLDEAAGHHIKEEFKPFFVGKAKAYHLFADSGDRNQEIIALLLNDPATKFDELLPKLEELAKRRDAAIAEATQLAADADKQAEKLNPPTKP
jgi:hypothetical protein